MHPEGRTKEQVGLAFWPDASAAQLRNSFHVTLHRLRKALGTSGVDHPRRTTAIASIPAVLEEFDVLAFERDVAAARRALKRQEEGASAKLEQALARFRGDFLDGEPVGDWHLEHRDRLQRIYVDALMELGARLAAEERHAKAAEAYRRVLARDELHEEALLALMKCARRHGRALSGAARVSALRRPHARGARRGAGRRHDGVLREAAGGGGGMTQLPLKYCVLDVRSTETGGRLPECLAGSRATISPGVSKS